MSQYSSSQQQKLVNELLLRLKSRDSHEQPNQEDHQSHLVHEGLENRLLNTQALSEYELIKERIVFCASELNKYLDFDDQFKASTYQNCCSVRFRNRVLVIEFKQIPFDNSQINHSLDLIFQVNDASFANGSRTTLVLSRQRGDFVWHQLQPVVHAPAATSKHLAASLLRWLEDGTDVF